MRMKSRKEWSMLSRRYQDICIVCNGLPNLAPTIITSIWQVLYLADTIHMSLDPLRH